MRFRSGAKLRRFKFTVYEKPPLINPMTQQPMLQTRALRAIFHHGDEHTFDSLEGQKEFSWTDHERQVVEKELCNPRNGYWQKVNGRGIWLEEGQAGVPAEVVAAIDDTAEMCRGTIVVDGQPQPCTNLAVPGGAFCDDHLLDALSQPEKPKAVQCEARWPEGDDEEGKPNIVRCPNVAIEGSDLCEEHTFTPKDEVPDDIEARVEAEVQRRLEELTKPG